MATSKRINKQIDFFFMLKTQNKNKTKTKQKQNGILFKGRS